MDLSKRDDRWQKQLYYCYADKMFMLCMRYVKNESDAATLVNEGFFKIFKNIENKDFENKNHKENWMRKIIINECLMFLRKKQSMFSMVETEPEVASELSADYKLVAEDYHQMIRALPVGYRTVFNLYAIEGYSHDEISNELKISASTSRSQLARARALLQKWLKKSNV